MDETKQCKKDEISRKIKYELKDKIDEGKISGRWIEKCLPDEYKRRYEKSELTPLSQFADSLERNNEEISNEFVIPREKYDDLEAAMHTSKDFVCLVFKNGILQDATSDLAKA